MTDLVKVPYTELFQRAASIRQQAEAVRREIVSLTETIGGIEWMGRRAERFFRMWEEARPEMDNWVTILESFATDLENQARRMQSADESF
ncbi:MAG TPA: WXG100 family type VII secretion target [Candidatus Limnocylindrales bacterium]|nr:WXG100 family type VII secretion target [Candidatus Limnocylindrales bacterium]